jgi:phage tail-like protein
VVIARQISNFVNDLFGQVGMTNRFYVALGFDLFDLGEWQRVSGLAVNWDKVDFRVGDMGNDSLLYAGNAKYSDIKLMRAACGASQDVQSWLSAMSNRREPVTGALSLHDWLGFKIVEWEIRELIPIGWSITDFDAGDGKVAIETLQIAHTGFLSDQIVAGLNDQARAGNW